MKSVHEFDDIGIVVSKEDVSFSENISAGFLRDLYTDCKEIRKNNTTENPKAIQKHDTLCIKRQLQLMLECDRFLRKCSF